MQKHAKECKCMQKHAQVCKSLHKYAKINFMTTFFKFYDNIFPPFFKFVTTFEKCYDNIFPPFLKFCDDFFPFLFDNFRRLMTTFYPCFCFCFYFVCYAVQISSHVVQNAIIFFRVGGCVKAIPRTALLLSKINI